MTRQARQASQSENQCDNDSFAQSVDLGENISVDYNDIAIDNSWRDNISLKRMTKSQRQQFKTNVYNSWKETKNEFDKAKCYEKSNALLKTSLPPPSARIV